MMYAQVSNSQLVNATEGHSLHRGDGSVVSNPTAEQLAAEGFYPVPAIPAGKMATSWSLVDGSLVPVLADAPKAARVFSKMKLVAALTKLGYWPQVKSYIEAQGLTDLYLAAQVVAEDNDYFVAGLAAVKQTLGLTDEQIESVLANCIAE